MRRNSRIWRRITGFRSPPPTAPKLPERRDHVILLDGTMSSLAPGCETNIGLTYRLLMDLPPDAPVTVYYEPGIQWRGLKRAHEVMAGIGINRQIKRAYLFLARNYRPGDRIYLMGYSRGAYAVRSLAGLIDKMGLLRAAQIDEDTLDRVYEHYRTDPTGPRARALRDALCHSHVPIAFLGVYDTVRALGIRWPILWRFAGDPHPYHDHELGASTEVARHALALHERREAYRPILWDTDAATPRVAQVWFRGTHGDVGGHLLGNLDARPLSNIPLTWMLAEAEAAGLALPGGWRARYPTDVAARSVGSLRGFGKLFLLRRRRLVGRDISERLHISAAGFATGTARPLPLAEAKSRQPA